MTAMSTRLRNVAALCALVGAGMLVAGAFVDARRTAFAYLVAFAWVFGVSVGALGLVMIGYATHARWFVVLRRVCEAMAIVVPLLILLFVPIALWTKKLYLWADDPLVWSEHVRAVIHARGRWHSPLAFFVRSAVYLVVLAAFAVVLRRESIRQEREGYDPERRAMARIVGGGGLPVVGLVLTFASWDWFMSVDPTWTSNIYGLYVFAGGFLAALALLALAAHVAKAHALLPEEVGASHFHAVGNLMLAMVVFWAWMAFSQLVVLWSTDIPEETSFYVARWSNVWRAVSVILIVGHFFVPFLLLLQRRFKRDSRALALIGVWILVVHWIDVDWLIMPFARPSGSPVHWVDLGAALFVFGLSTALGAWRFAAASPVPAKDPALASSLEFEMS